jgi:hypothetical protein
LQAIIDTDRTNASTITINNDIHIVCFTNANNAIKTKHNVSKALRIATAIALNVLLVMIVSF